MYSFKLFSLYFQFEILCDDEVQAEETSLKQIYLMTWYGKVRLFSYLTTWPGKAGLPSYLVTLQGEDSLYLSLIHI